MDESNNLLSFIKKIKSNPRSISIATFSIFPIISYIMTEMINGSHIFLNWKYIILNLIFIYGFQLILYAITSSYKKSILISNTFFYVISIINYIVTDFRGTPIVPWDILCINVAFNVAKSFKGFTISYGLIMRHCFVHMYNNLGI